MTDKDKEKLGAETEPASGKESKESKDGKGAKDKKNKKYPLWKNVFAMIAVVAVFITAAYWASILYTRHGKEVAVPDLKGLTVRQAYERLDALEEKIGNCYVGGAASTACDGNELEVSFAWNGADPFTDGGTASAISADPERPAVYFWFLIHDSANDIYFKSRVARGGEGVMWRIDDAGAVTAEPGLCANVGHAVIAVDAQGCEGMVLVSLPTASNGGGTP